jgi:hypothetical protein
MGLMKNKELREGRVHGKLVIWPGPYNRGGLEVYDDLEEAKAQANYEADRYAQYRYVYVYKDGYVVLGYADVWDYFGEWDEAAILYKVDPPRKS